MAASKPPAEPPIPTIGQAGEDFCFSRAPPGPNCGLAFPEIARRCSFELLFFFLFAGIALLIMIGGQGGPEPRGLYCSPNHRKCLDARSPRAAGPSASNKTSFTAS